MIYLAILAVIALVGVVVAAVIVKTTLMLTIASALALLVLLAVLAMALIKILAALQGIEYSIGKIAMGVNAIDQETSALPPALEGIKTQFVPLRDGLRQVDDDLKTIVAKL